MVSRFPVQIGNFEVHPSDYNIDDFIEILKSSVNSSIQKMNYNCALLLSGGIDSSIMLKFVKETKSDIMCFTIGNNWEHPDVQYAMKLTSLWDVNHRIYLPNKKSIQEVSYRKIYKADHGVYLILKEVSKYCNNIIATDGIDELMGGYWKHFNSNNLSDTFNKYWNELEEKHLSPMYKSAIEVGVNIYWVYLNDDIVNYISRIPLEIRVNSGRKSLWKEIARRLEIPDWIINRDKIGFCDCLGV